MGVCATGTALGPEVRATGTGLPVRLVHRWLPAGEREGVHSHSFVEFCHIESGRGLLRTGDESGVAGAHTLTVVPPGTAHALAADNGWACTANLLHFEVSAVPAGQGAALRDLCRLAASGHARVSLRGAAGRAIEADLVQVGALSRQADLPAREACGAGLGRLCVRVLRQVRDARVAAPSPQAPPARPEAAPAAGREETAAAARPEIDHVLAYIERNLARSISRQDLARQASFAPSYFSALFREATGTTIPEYINARRVVRAQELLRQPQTRVSAVCYAVGFRDLSNFNRVFKRIVGQTPREYRRAVLGDAYEEPEEADAEVPAAAPAETALAKG